MDCCVIPQKESEEQRFVLSLKKGNTLLKEPCTSRLHWGQFVWLK